jgi:maleylacetoacetate isomerase
LSALRRLIARGTPLASVALRLGRSYESTRWRVRREGIALPHIGRVKSRAPTVAERMKLYTYYRSTAAYRVRIALNVKGVPYESISTHLRRGEHRDAAFLEMNPQGLIPALVDDTSVISQSLAIIEYLDETYADPPLLPRGVVERARVRSMALAVACDMHPLNNLRVLNFLRGALGCDEELVNTTWYHHWISQGFQALELEARRWTGDGRYLFGSDLTIADVCLLPQWYNATRFKCDLEPYPTLRAICAHLETLPSFAKAAPEVQSDAE